MYYYNAEILPIYELYIQLCKANNKIAADLKHFTIDHNAVRIKSALSEHLEKRKKNITDLFYIIYKASLLNPSLQTDLLNIISKPTQSKQPIGFRDMISLEHMVIKYFEDFSKAPPQEFKLSFMARTFIAALAKCKIILDGNEDIFSNLANPINTYTANERHKIVNFLFNLSDTNNTEYLNVMNLCQAITLLQLFLHQNEKEVAHYSEKIYKIITDLYLLANTPAFDRKKFIPCIKRNVAILMALQHKYSSMPCMANAFKKIVELISESLEQDIYPIANSLIGKVYNELSYLIFEQCLYDSLAVKRSPSPTELTLLVLSLIHLAIKQEFDGCYSNWRPILEIILKQGNFSAQPEWCDAGRLNFTERMILKTINYKTMFAHEQDETANTLISPVANQLAALKM